MKIVARKKSTVSLPGRTGTLRVDRHTSQLVRRLAPGDVAVLDHLDLDRATAQRIADSGAVAVLNAGPSSSGRFANQGPAVLLAAGLEVWDNAGTEVLALRDGTAVRLHDGQLLDADGTVLATGRVLDDEIVAAEQEVARRQMRAQLATFTHNATEFLTREEPLLLHGTGLPELPEKLANRPVLVVTGGPHAAEELRAVKAWQREQRPVLVGVDAGTALLAEQGLTPDVIVLDVRADLPATTLLRAAKQVVVRVEPGATRTATEAFERAGVRAVRVPTSAGAEDVALLVAATRGAPVVVAVGADATLVEFLDSRRRGLAGAFLTRLSLGPRLVDAASVPSLYSGRVRPRHLVLLLLAGLLALVAAVAVTPVGQEWAEALGRTVSDLFDTLQGKFS